MFRAILSRPGAGVAGFVASYACSLHCSFHYATAESAPVRKLATRKTERVGDAVTVLPEDGLCASEWRALKLESVTALSHNTAVYRFAFADKRSPSGMTVCCVA